MDGNSFAPLPPYPYDTAVNETAAYARTLSFRCPTVYEAELRNMLNYTTYRMVYSGNFTNISPYFWMGSYHSSELPLNFGTYGDFRSNGTAFEKATSEAMQDMYLAFAKDPENGPATVGWSKYTDGYIEQFGAVDSNGKENAAQLIPKDVINQACTGYYS
jgi:acetylcholinesterase